MLEEQLVPLARLKFCFHSALSQVWGPLPTQENREEKTSQAGVWVLSIRTTVSAGQPVLIFCSISRNEPFALVLGPNFYLVFFFLSFNFNSCSLHLCCSDWVFVLFPGLVSLDLSFWSSPQFFWSRCSAFILTVCPWTPFSKQGSSYQLPDLSAWFSNYYLF